MSDRILEAKMLASRSFYRDGQDIGLSSEREESLEIKRFAGPTAAVTVSMGMTINVGNYESARVDVSLTVPCYFEEHEAAYEYAKKFVEKRTLDEANQARAFFANRSAF